MNEKEIIDKIESRKKEFAKSILSRFDFETVVKEAISDSNKEALYLIPANLGFFGLCTTLILSSESMGIKNNPIFILLISAAFISIVSLLLIIWYLARYKARSEHFNQHQSKILAEAEERLIKILSISQDLIRLSPQEELNNLLEDKKNIEKGNPPSSIFQQTSFMTDVVLKLAIKETELNMSKSYIEVLDEKWPTFKLICDNLSEKLRFFLPLVTIVLILTAIIVKFLE